MSPAQACQWCGFAFSGFPNIMRPFLKGVHADDGFMSRFTPDSLQCKACRNYAVMMLDEQLRKTELAAVKKNEQMRGSWRVKVFGAPCMTDIVALFKDNSLPQNCHIGSYRANNGDAWKATREQRRSGRGASKEPREQRRSDRVCELSEYVVSALFRKYIYMSLLYIQFSRFAHTSLDVEHLESGAS